MRLIYLIPLVAILSGCVGFTVASAIFGTVNAVKTTGEIEELEREVETLKKEK